MEPTSQFLTLAILTKQWKLLAFVPFGKYGRFGSWVVLVDILGPEEFGSFDVTYPTPFDVLAIIVVYLFFGTGVNHHIGSPSR